MYPHQSERLSEARERAGVEALIATSPANVAYVSGFRSLAHALDETAPVFAVFAPAGTALVVPALEAAAVAAAAPDVGHVVCHGTFAVAAGAPGETTERLQALSAQAAATAGEALAAALEALGVKAGPLGLDGARLPHGTAARLGERLGRERLRPASEAFAAARRVKGPWEIECLQQALHVAEEALDATLDALQAGVTEREIATQWAHETARRGGAARHAIVAFGPNSAVPTAWPTERPLRPRDVVRFDLGCVSRGFHATLARTAVLGEPDASLEALCEELHAGLQAALGAVAPGARADGVFAAGRAGAPGNHLGHGIGLEAVEAPWLAAGGDVLEAGMVLAVETARYAIGAAGVSIRDTVLVTRAGAVPMNRSNPGLLVL